MTVNRFNWSVAALGGRVVPCLTIAGSPYLFVPPGVTVASVAWSDSTDSGWSLGATPTCKDWLRLTQTRIEATARLPGDKPDVSGLTVDLVDPAGEATSYLGGRRAMARTLLAAECSAAATTLTVERTTGFPASGALHVGGERVTYSGVASGPARFTGLTRGTAGTRARKHVLRQGSFALEVFGGATERLPSLKGRRAMLWALALDAAGVATDPILLWDGVCAPGAEVAAGWRLPLVPAVRALETKLRARRVTLSGWAHDEPPGTRANTDAIPDLRRTPLGFWWDHQVVCLTSESAAPDNGGWHGSREAFFGALRAAIIDVGVDLRVFTDGAGRLMVQAHAGADSRLYVWAPWIVGANPVQVPDSESTDTDLTYNPGDAVPSACLWVNGTVRLTALDVATLPAVPGVLDAASHTEAWWTLTAPMADGETRAARITAVGTTSVTATPADPPSTPEGYYREMLVLAPTAADVGLQVESDQWWSAIRYGVLGAIDAAEGSGQLADTVDWASLAALAATYPGGLPPRRRYQIAGEEAFIDLLVREGAANGLTLAVRRGRLGFVRLRDAASTEPATWTVTAADLAGGTLPRPRWSTQGCATAYVWSLPNGDTVRVIDGAAEDEQGQGREIKVTLPPGSFDTEGVGGGALLAAFEAIGSQVLGPVRGEYQEVSLTLPLRFAGIEIGDTVRVSEYLAAPGDGTRGLAGAVCVVTGRSLEFDWPAGRGVVEVTARVASGDAVGYAPEFLVSAGGIAGAVITADATTSFSLDGRSVVDGFSAGDKVLLYQYDDATPATLSATVASVDPVAGTLTLTSPPGATWEGYAAGQYGVMVGYDDYTTATNAGDPAQHAFAFITVSGSLLGGTDTPHRYTA